MTSEFTHDKSDFNDIKSNREPFYYYYRSKSEKEELHNKFCYDMKLFYDTVCLYEKNKDNPNCPDLLEYLKRVC